MRSEWSVEQLQEQVGREIGVSSWIHVPQDRINTFADSTEDHQFIHVDPERAAKTELGGTIAHGFLVLSLMSAMANEVVPPIKGMAMGLNYGFDRLRFVAPVPVGSFVRGHFKLLGATV